MKAMTLHATRPEVLIQHTASKRPSTLVRDHRDEDLLDQPPQIDDSPGFSTVSDLKRSGGDRYARVPTIHCERHFRVVGEAKRGKG